jgi:C-terminal processing protease CtpA/Prc
MNVSGTFGLCGSGDDPNQIGQNFYVKAMPPDGPAAACGKIKINDMLASVNGRGVSNQITEASLGNSHTFLGLILALFLPNAACATRWTG